MRTFGRLLQLMAPFRWWVALAVLLSFGTLGATVGLMAMSAYLISKAALVSGFFELAVAVVLVRAFAIARASLRYAERYVTHLATFRILTRLRVWFYTSIEPLAPARLAPYHSGDLFTRIGADIETLENFYVRVVVPPLTAVLVTALACAILGYFDMTLGLVLFGFLVLTGVILPLVTRSLSQMPSAQLSVARVALNTILTDEIQGIADVMAFGRQADFQQRAWGLSTQLEQARTRLAVVRGISNALAVLFAGLAGVTVLALAIPLVTGGKLEGVMLALIPLTAIAAFEAVQPLGTALQQLEASQVAAKRLFELIDMPPVVVEPVKPLPLPATYSLEFRNVTFAYAPDEPPALSEVSFKLENGAHVGIIGQSGAGKSTLVNLLLRFWDPQQGQIFLGGNDLHSYRSADVRHLLGVVSQHTHLFNGTFRDNLLLAKGDATDAEINVACQQALLAEFIAHLPLGLDTLVGENGLKLSGGERQRLAIARVILKQAPILILDEATANLDALTEMNLMQALEPFMQRRTTLIISHRPAGLAHVSQTLVFEHGHLMPAPPEGAPRMVQVPDAALIMERAA